MLPIDYIISECEKNGIILDQNAPQRMIKYYEMLIERNKVMNLTSITEPNEVAEKHFLDSLMLFKYVDIPNGASVIDVGTGAGFPGMVLKIARPDIKLTLLDSLNKRIIFLNEVTDALTLSTETVHARAEDAGGNAKYREKFDYSVARAVARLSVLSELCLPLIIPSGSFICMKGPEPDAEISDSQRAVELLGGKFYKKSEFNLPCGDGRSIIQIKKTSQTPPKYPRQGIKISKKPL